MNRLPLVIHVAANSKIGIGHLSRSVSLAKCIDNNIFDIYMIIEGEKITSLLDNFSFKYEIVKSRNHALKLRSKIANGILITDILELKSEDSLYARNQGFKMLIDMAGPRNTDYRSDICFCGDIFCKDKYAFCNGIKYFKGPSYHIIDPEIYNMRPTKPWNKNHISSCLITMGGSDPGYQTEQLCQLLIKLKNLPKTTIVAGLTFSSDRIQNLKKNFPLDITIVENPIVMAKHILSHDLIITMGGGTSYEAMFLGLPVCALEWSYLSDYVKNMEDYGVISSLGEVAKADLRFLNLVENTKTLCCNAHTAWETIDGLGCKRTAKIIIDVCYE